MSVDAGGGGANGGTEKAPSFVTFFVREGFPYAFSFRLCEPLQFGTESFHTSLGKMMMSSSSHSTFAPPETVGDND